MVAVKDEGIILEKTNLKFENKGVFNPACIQVDGITHMFYRAINQSDISSIGYCQLKENEPPRSKLRGIWIFYKIP